MSLRTAWIASIILLLVPAGMLLYDNKAFTPLVAFLISFAQFFLALHIGKLQSEHAARKTANAKWLPPAESACDRLLTVKSSVLNLRQQTKGACQKAAEDLPEIKEPNNKAVKILFERQCSEIASRLVDVENHLEGAFQDWIRFIRQNCEGSECERIWRSLLERKQSLRLNEVPSSCGSQPATPAPTDIPLHDDAGLSLIISGTTDGCNGGHILRRAGKGWQSKEFQLQEESFGWAITDLRTKQIRFVRQEADQIAAPGGVYLPCETCAGGGAATVS